MSFIGGAGSDDDDRGSGGGGGGSGGSGCDDDDRGSDDDDDGDGDGDDDEDHDDDDAIRMIFRRTNCLGSTRRYSLFFVSFSASPKPTNLEIGRFLLIRVLAEISNE